MGSLWTTRCSGCEKLWTTLHGGQYCTTPGCKYASNLPVSKTGMSSPGKPIQDPALARENIMLERATGWTPALPFTDFVKCRCWVMAAPPDQQARLPHDSRCPLYEGCDECGSVGFHKMSCSVPGSFEDTVGGFTWQGLSGAKAVLLPNATVATGGPLKCSLKCPLKCPLCAMSEAGEHEETCPAKPGHSCKFCGRPIVSNLGGWMHDSTNDFQKCGKAPSPKAKKLTGVCMHGNPRAGGCQACDTDTDTDTDPFETKLCIHGKPTGVAFGTCWECNA